MWRPNWPVVPLAQGVGPIGTSVKNGAVGVAAGLHSAAASATTASTAARARAVAPGRRPWRMAGRCPGYRGARLRKIMSELTPHDRVAIIVHREPEASANPELGSSGRRGVFPRRSLRIGLDCGEAPTR